jgi:hypothetical protein
LAKAGPNTQGIRIISCARLRQYFSVSGKPAPKLFKEMRFLNAIVPTIKVLILFCIVFSCSKPLYSNDGPSRVRTSIMRLCNNLNREQIVHLGAPVSYAGKIESSNRYFKAYKRLRRKATVDELVALCKSESKVILTYAFAALVYKQSPAAKVVFEQNLQDTSLVWHSGGCTGVLRSVNSFMLSSLAPQPGAKSLWMAQEEYDAYLVNLLRSNTP